MRYILVLAAALLISGAGCGSGPHDENREFLTIGPYTRTCYGLSEQECFLTYNEASRQWEFFYEEIQGFAFEPGFVYVIEVRVEDRGTEILDAGRYAYHLAAISNKREVSGGSYSTGFTVDGERLYAERDTAGDTDQAPAPVVVHPATWEPPLLSAAAVLADRILRREYGALLLDPTDRRELAAEIAPVLSGIRNAYPELADLTVQAPYAFGQLVLTLETWLFEAVASLVEDQAGRVTLRTGHAPFDALNERLGLSVVLDLFPRFGVVIFYFSEYLNAPAAAALYEAMEGVKFAEPNGRLGDGPDIDMARSEGRWYVVARRARGDCPSGCLYEEFHFFIADDTGVERIEPWQAAAIAEFEELAATFTAALPIFAGHVSDDRLTAKVIIDDTGAGTGAWRMDPYVIETDRDDGLVIDGDTLTVTVSYSGGCEEHDFTLVASGEFRDSHPAQLEVFLAHDGQGDRCKAYPTESRHFDLSPVRALYRAAYQKDTGTVILNLVAAREAAYQLVYTFGE